MMPGGILGIPRLSIRCLFSLAYRQEKVASLDLATLVPLRGDARLEALPEISSNRINNLRKPRRWRMLSCGWKVARRCIQIATQPVGKASCTLWTNEINESRVRFA